MTCFCEPDHVRQANEEVREYFITINISNGFQLVFVKTPEKYLLANECIKTLKSLNIDKIWIVGEDPKSIDEKFVLHYQVKVGTSPNFNDFAVILRIFKPLQ